MSSSPNGLALVCPPLFLPGASRRGRKVPCLLVPELAGCQLPVQCYMRRRVQNPETGSPGPPTALGKGDVPRLRFPTTLKTNHFPRLQGHLSWPGHLPSLDHSPCFLGSSQTALPAPRIHRLLSRDLPSAVPISNALPLSLCLCLRDSQRIFLEHLLHARYSVYRGDLVPALSDLTQGSCTRVIMNHNY